MPGNSRGGGLLDGLAALVEKLAELAEKGERLQRSGEVTSSDEKVKAAYDLDVRIGVGEEAGEAPEGPRREVREGRAVVQPIREPLVDVFDEAPGLLIVAQLPGVECGEISLELRGDVLAIEAEHDGLRYEKELLLPRPYPRDRMRATCRNGVLEIRMNGGEGAAP
ncbi:MAG TPA: gas vesicle protein GvpH [Vulgatibacter sp.]|nr:gas vesicle protein GvpH [Vulgatibacter sp.]